MKKYSIWLENIKDNILPSLNKNLNVDVLIIGGGITGMSTLYELSKTKLNTVLVERNICGKGVTSKSTAKITYLQEKIYMNIRKFGNEKKALTYLESQIDAMNILTDIITKENIDCNLKQVSSYLFTNDLRNTNKIEEEYKFLKQANVNATLLDKLPFNEKCIKALKVDDTYVFHPLKYINHLKNKLSSNIYENTSVTSINKENNYYICSTTNNCQIKAKYIVIATHYPSFLFPFLMPLKNYVETSFVGAKKVKNINDISAINIDRPTISLRYLNDHNNYLIYLYNSLKSADIKDIKEHFKDLTSKDTFDYIWSNKDIITNDYIPYIGSINKNDNTFLIATGYNTWGMTNSTIASIVLKDIILNKSNKYIELFSPTRVINLTKTLRFPLDISLTVKSLLKSNKSNVNNSKVIYKKINGKTVATYIDEDGIKHTIQTKCPHMKCGLILNETEKTWDCLCHGSRFDLDGKVLEGPSNEDITFK